MGHGDVVLQKDLDLPGRTWWASRLLVGVRGNMGNSLELTGELQAPENRPKRLKRTVSFRENIYRIYVKVNSH